MSWILNVSRILSLLRNVMHVQTFGILSHFSSLSKPASPHTTDHTLVQKFPSDSHMSTSNWWSVFGGNLLLGSYQANTMHIAILGDFHLNTRQFIPLHQITPRAWLTGWWTSQERMWLSGWLVASLVEREARCECEAKHDIAMLVTMLRAKIKTGETNILFIYLDFAKLFFSKPNPQMLWTLNDVVSLYKVHNKAPCSILIIPTSGEATYPMVMLLPRLATIKISCFTCECSLQSWNHCFISHPIIHSDTQRKFGSLGIKCKKLFNNCSTR